VVLILWIKIPRSLYLNIYTKALSLIGYGNTLDVGLRAKNIVIIPMMVMVLFPLIVNLLMFVNVPSYKSYSYKKRNLKKKKITNFCKALSCQENTAKNLAQQLQFAKYIDGIGVEKIFPIHSPLIKNIEIIRRTKVRRAKLFYLRTAKGKRARLKAVPFTPTKSTKNERNS